MAEPELEEDEGIDRELSPARVSGLLPLYILGVLTLVVGVGLIILIWLEIHRSAKTYYITDRRIVEEFKFIVKKKTSIPYHKITDMSPSQGIIARLTNSGNIRIQTAGTHTMEMDIKHIKQPDRVVDLIYSEIAEATGEETEDEEDNPEEILKQRFARGEISEEEFQKKMGLLNGETEQEIKN